ncbi:MAG: hypothetical protein IPJ75_06105 [Ignavibacteriales bacterium]|nr:hypothetical protein [Ignavibacteriales bacterium]
METNNLHNEEEQFKELRTLLKEMPKVDAPPGFEADLMRRINSEKYATAKPGLFAKIAAFFKPVPSAIAVGVVAIVAVVMLVNQPGEIPGGDIKTPVQEQTVVNKDAGKKVDDKSDNSPEFEHKEQEKLAKNNTPPAQPEYRGFKQSEKPPVVSKYGGDAYRDQPAATAVSPTKEDMAGAVAESMKSETKLYTKSATVSTLHAASSIKKKADSLKSQQSDTTSQK